MVSAMSYGIGAAQAALPVTDKPRAPHGSGMWIPAKAKSSRSGRAEARESCASETGARCEPGESGACPPRIADP